MTRNSLQEHAKQWIDANVWDGEDCTGRDHSAIFAPDDLQELIDELIEDLFHDYYYTKKKARQV